MQYPTVRGDIERLLSEKALTLVPTKEVVDTMLELTIYNRKHTVYERQQCYSVCPINFCPPISNTHLCILGSSSPKLPVSPCPWVTNERADSSIYL